MATARLMLADLAQGRDNNFNLIRIVSACAVLVGHSFPLALGKGGADPAGLLVGLPAIAVDVFFVTSGFLVTGSLLSRGIVLEFAWARALRIFPALAVMVVLSVFGLGVYFTTHALGAYLTDPKTLNYLVKNVILFRDVVWNLPGVFEANPYRNAVNGSLWTLPKEVKLYALLAAMWIVAGVVPGHRLRSFRVAVICFAILGAVVVVVRHVYWSTEVVNWRLFYMFFSGAAMYVLKERIFVARPAFWSIVGVLALTAVDRSAFFVVYALTLGYIVLFLAYVPAGRVRLYNRVGDYSYGVYIYAFPVQQSIAALIPGVSPWSMIAIASAVTLALAALSWHIVERRALACRSRCVGYSRLAAGRLRSVLLAWLRRAPSGR